MLPLAQLSVSSQHTTLHTTYRQYPLQKCQQHNNYTNSWACLTHMTQKHIKMLLHYWRFWYRNVKYMQWLVTLCLRPERSTYLGSISYRLDYSGFESQQGASYFSVSQNLQTNYGEYPASVQWELGSFLWVGQLGREREHPPASSAYVKNEWNYTSAPSLCLHGVDREKFKGCIKTQHKNI